MWVPFWFEANLGWGQITSISDWERIKNSYKNSGVDLLSAKRFDGAETPYFGFAIECRGKETLDEFAKKNEMEM